MGNETFSQAQQEMIQALQDGRRTLAAISRVGTGDQVRHGELGGMAAALADPAAFWAQAAGGVVQADQGQVELTAAAIRATAAKLAACDMTAIREALVGQAGWLSAMSLRLAAVEVSGPGKHEAQVNYLKLSLRAAESAAKNLASAAALDAVAAGTITVGSV